MLLHYHSIIFARKLNEDASFQIDSFFGIHRFDIPLILSVIWHNGRADAISRRYRPKGGHCGEFLLLIFYENSDFFVLRSNSDWN